MTHTYTVLDDEELDMLCDFVFHAEDKYENVDDIPESELENIRFYTGICVDVIKKLIEEVRKGNLHNRMDIGDYLVKIGEIDAYGEYWWE